MRNKFLLSIIFLVLFAIPCIAQQGIFINEVMASNQNTIADNTGDFSDWVELHNSNSSPVVLDGYYISDDLANPLKFRFWGNVQIPANGYLILWGSGDTTRGRTHLPFKFSASGENVTLYSPDGTTLVNSISFGQQKADVSFGRTTDDSPAFSFFAIPTPVASNNTSTGYLGILSEPVFSANAGFYQNPFTLTISSTDPNVEIIYTTDGSAPDTANKKGTIYRYKNVYPQFPGNVVGPFLYDSFRTDSYVNPLPITDASVKANRLAIKSSTYEFAFSAIPSTVINKGTIIRAVVSKAGYISSEVATASYFITPDGKNKYTLPVLSLAMSEDQLYSWDKGINNAGTDFEQWRAANPTLNVIGGEPANYQRGTEFPMSFEMFTANNTTRQLQTNAGWTVNGNYSRTKTQKAFRVYFKSSYGASDLNYRIFTDLPYKNYERLILSNSGQDMTSTHIRDMAIQYCVKHLRADIQRGQPTISFVNGEFWGLLNIRERFDDNYFNQKYGIKTDEIDFIEKNATVKNGNNIDILNLRNYFAANDISNTTNYQYVKTRIDVDNFIDYNISEVYFGNNDWPGNNYEFYHKRTAYNPAAVPKEQDGRWRWVLQDLDRGLSTPWATGGGPAYNTLSLAIGTKVDAPQPVWATIFLSKLLSNTEFRNQFITRYADLINTTFIPENITSGINYYRDMVSSHISEHLDRWRRPANATAWNDTVNTMVTFANQRPSYARQHLREQFSLSNEQEITIDVSDSAEGFITVNSIDITPAFPGVPTQAYPWKGLYFPEVPVTLIAKPKQGFRFVHWEGDSISTRDTLITILSRAKYFKAIFESIDIPVSKVFQYWHFNKLPQATTLTAVNADTSLTGNAFIAYEGTGAGFMDASVVTEGSNLNAQFSYPSGSSLRARNPSATRTIIINAPTTGYKNIVLAYATSRTTKGAQSQRVYYSTNGTVWTLKADNILVANPETTFGLQTFDFTSDISSDNNPLFKIKIEFFGTNATGTSGNDRFDNVSFSGIPLFKDPPATTLSIASDRPGSVCSNSKVTFTATSNKVIPTPVFQWKKNGIDVGSNSNTYSDINFQNKDTVYCILTVNNTPVQSNKIILGIIPNYMTVIGVIKTAPSACSNDGKLIINGAGGTSPYQYSLNNVDYFSSNTFTNLAAGSYTAYIQDVKGCTAAQLSTILSNAFAVTSLTKTAAAACKDDGSIAINSSGGTPPLQYSLNNVDYFTGNVFSNLAAGNYTAYVKDANGCVTAAFADILTKASPLIIANLYKITPSGCSADGKLTIDRTGGTAPYQYSLNNVDYFSSNIFSNLAAGSYTAYVKDAKGCIAVRSEVLNKYSALIITSIVKVIPSACNNSNGSLAINVSGGTSPFQYSLNNINYFTSNLFSNLASGSYITYVKDYKGCITSLPVTITAASSLVITGLTKIAATSCNADGKITINVTGGGAPYQYSLNNINYFSTNSFSNLAGGSYTAYIKDANGCAASLSDILTNSSSLVITSLTKTAASACNSDGKITVNRTGGTAPFTYSLNNVDYFSSNIFSNLAAGTYVVFVKDANGCSTSFSDVISKTPPLVISSLSKTAASACTLDGSITINSTGGTPPLQYSLNNVNYFSSNIFSNLAAGTYTGFVKDANGCIYTLVDILTKASPLLITSLSKTDASGCNADGSITINNTGGTPPLQYSLNNVNYFASNVFSNLAGGNYTLYVKDVRGCTTTINDIINQTSSLVITGLDKIDPTACNANGKITINSSGGTAPYQYSLNNVNYFTSNEFPNLTAGSYTAFTKDANGCITSVSGSLTAASPLIITSLSKTTASACNADGSITINSTGGTAPLQYSLDNINYVPSNIFSNLTGGNYTAYVKDASGCTATITELLNQAPSLVITSLTKIDAAACIANGKITINSSGGTAPLQYSLDNINYGSSNVFSNLAGGSYTAYIKDSRGCTITTTELLNQAAPPVINSLTKADASACNADGKITINSSGGTAPLQYSIDNISYGTSNVFSNLAGGSYTAYVKDANGCTATITEILNQAPPLVINSLTTTDASACIADGSITISSTGGTGPLQYSLDNISYISSNVFSNLAGGSYTAYVKDVNGCTVTTTELLNQAPPLIITSLTENNPSACNLTDGSVTINSSGGTAPLQYSLNNIDYVSGNEFTNLAAGNYTAYVKDANGCIASLVDALSNGTSPIITSLTIADASACNTDGTITINISGGTPPLQYSLDNIDYISTNEFTNLAAGNYSAYVKDVNGCIATTTELLSQALPVVINSVTKTDASACNANGTITINSSGGTAPLQYSLDDINYVSSNVFSNLSGGSYTAYVKDAKGCTATISEILNQSPPLVINSLIKTDASACNADGKITIHSSGGTAPLQYSIDNVNYFSSNLFSSLAGGSYTAYVKDVNGCTVTVTEILNQAPPLVINSLTKTPASACNADGSISISSSGGTAPLQYSLDNISFVSSNLFSNLAGGNYTAYVKDATGCTATVTESLNQAPPLVISSLTKIDPTACNANGSITINSMGGTAPLQYSLNNVNYVSSNVFASLTGGSYTTYVKDAKGCITSVAASLTAASPLVITSLSKTPASACNADGSITVNSSGGNSPYQYSLDNVNYSTSNIFSNLAGGTYTVYIKDVNGCTASQTDNLIAASPLVITSISKIDASACNADGSITINSSGGTAALQYSLNNVTYTSSNLFSNLAAGSYTGYVKDSKGCINSLAVIINKAPALVITSLTKVAASACNNNDGKITINNSGGTAPFTYSLNNVTYVSSNLFNNLAGGTYTVYVKDARNCIATFTDVLSNGSSLLITSLTKITVAACKSDGVITINRTGGTSPFTYSLNNINYFTSNVFSNLAGGTYTAYVKDAKGCIATYNDVLTKASSLVISNIYKITVSGCRNDGSLTIERTGGTSPFTYSLNNVNFFSTSKFSNLASGTYTCYVKDARGCTAPPVTTFLNTYSPLIINRVNKVNPTACANNGQLTIYISGGTTPFTYSLNNVNYFSSNVFNNLAAGTYTAYVKDAKNCIGTLTNITLTATACLPKASAPEPTLFVSSTKLSIKAYPNPSTEQFSIIAVSGDKKEVEVIITDLLGQKLLQTIIAPNSVFRFGKNLKAGTYIIGAFQDKQKAIINVVKGK